jgi:Peptidase A4 family
MPFGRKRALLAISFVAAAVVSTGGSAAAARPALQLRLQHSLELGNGTETSSNWAGYAVTHRKPFTSVTGKWVQPTATCTDLSSTYSAFWVGLGGFSANSFGVEQTGTLANCSGGSPSYTAWYELYPKPPVMLRTAVHPGDTLSATVSVSKKTVFIRLKNVTTGKLFTKRLRMNRPDLGSAEWVVEAPSGCDSAGNCSTLPLTNFGTVAFSHGTTTVKGHKGRISDPVWSETTIELHGDLNDPNNPSQAGANAIPRGLGPDGGSFAIDWQQLSAPTG